MCTSWPQVFLPMGKFQHLVSDSVKRVIKSWGHSQRYAWPTEVKMHTWWPASSEWSVPATAWQCEQDHRGSVLWRYVLGVDMSRISFIHLIGKVLSVVPVHHNCNRVDLQVKGALVTISNCDSQVRHILKLNWLLLVLDSALACHIEFGKWDLKKERKSFFSHLQWWAFGMSTAH